ncbi:MAG: class I SAM-dependent methyltransferase [Candidatus Hydrogenedentes bacterium]|nr:class I SAM-dependent methyltransferase [Candidatus Hydrogenedentota bacterium]
MRDALVRGVLPLIRKPAKTIAHALFDVETVSRLKAKWLPFDVVYNKSYFWNDVDGPATKSSATIAASILRDLKPKCVVDVGCGTGAFLLQLRESGCDVLGLEYAAAARAICEARELTVLRFDIARDIFPFDRKFDRAVVFSAARPGQGGTDHINEQPHDYWIEHFARAGLLLNDDLTQCWREEWKNSSQVQSWYYDNLMVFGSTAMGHRSETK